jgi:hypothetical protein
MLVFLIVKCTQMSVAAELVNNYWLIMAFSFEGHH